VKTYNQFINGRYVEPASGRWLDSIDPYTGQSWARIPQGCEKDADAAVTAANAAMKSGPWATMTATQRGKLMVKLAELIERRTRTGLPRSRCATTASC
jgi:acyl-CoA reductase-like NAD-dependent aldehyde dehydrogenase